MEKTMESTAQTMEFFAPYTDQLRNTLLKKNKTSAKLADKLRGKVVSGSKLQSSEIDSIVKQCNQPEDLLEICFLMEKSADPEMVEKLWLAGLEKFNSSALYLENLGYHYYQQNKYHKSLSYLSKAHTINKSFFAITLSIASAYSVAQYHMVWDYFSMLSKKEQSRLDDDMISKVAASGLHQQLYEEAGKLFEYLGKKIRSSRCQPWK